MKRIRIASKGWETFTGYLGMVRFENGVSADPVTPILKNKLAGQLTIMEIDDETGEEVQTGVAASMPGVVVTPAPLIRPLRRASEEEAAAEQKRIQAETFNGVRTVIHTKEELETVAGQKGIAGLRDIAKPWGVKDRSIPGLIRAILEAQADFVERQRAAKAAREGEAAAQQKAQQTDQTPNAVDENGKAIYVDPNPAPAPANAAETPDDKVIEGEGTETASGEGA